MMAATINSSTVRLLFLLGFYAFFLIVGAAIFSAIEAPVEKERLRDLRTVRNQFLFDRSSCITDDDLDKFIAVVIDAHKAGVTASKNSSNVPNWSFGQSLFFATSVLTTIGYGHVSPLSNSGKVFCVIYAALGIPLTLVLFTALVERLMGVTSLLLASLINGLGHLHRTVYIRLTHVGIIFCFVLVFVFLIPSAVFTILETNWNFLDSFYYCFISMTTIGLGDYIPGEDPHQTYRPLYKICTTGYLFIGLILMLLLVANVYDVPELNFGYYFYKRSDTAEGQEGPQSGLRSEESYLYAGDQPRYTMESTSSDTSRQVRHQPGTTGSRSGETSRRDDMQRLTEDE